MGRGVEPTLHGGSVLGNRTLLLCLALFFDKEEILPHGAVGDHFFGPDDAPLTGFSSNEVSGCVSV